MKLKTIRLVNNVKPLSIDWSLNVNVEAAKGHAVAFIHNRPTNVTMQVTRRVKKPSTIT